MGCRTFPEKVFTQSENLSLKMSIFALGVTGRRCLCKETSDTLRSTQGDTQTACKNMQVCNGTAVKLKIREQTVLCKRCKMPSCFKEGVLVWNMGEITAVNVLEYDMIDLNIEV